MKKGELRGKEVIGWAFQWLYAQLPVILAMKVSLQQINE
jgi:hypothetical protein